MVNVDLTGSGTITITGETSATPLLTATATVLDGTLKPIVVQTESNLDGTTNIGPGVSAPLFNERIKIVVAGGGVSKTGTLYVYVVTDHHPDDTITTTVAAS